MFTCQHEAIANRQHGTANALVRCNFRIEATDGFGVFVTVLRIYYRAVPANVINDAEAAGALKQFAFEGMLAVAVFDLHHPDVRVPLDGALNVSVGLGLRHQLVAE